MERIHTSAPKRVVEEAPTGHRFHPPEKGDWGEDFLTDRELEVLVYVGHICPTYMRPCFFSPSRSGPHICGPYKTKPSRTQSGIARHSGECRNPGTLSLFFYFFRIPANEGFFNNPLRDRAEAHGRPYRNRNPSERGPGMPESCRDRSRPVPAFSHNPPFIYGVRVSSTQKPAAGETGRPPVFFKPQLNVTLA